MITINVPAVPVAQPRAKATIRGKRAGVYTPKGLVDAYKATVRLAASQVYGGPPLSGPLRVWLTFTMPRPKAMMYKKREMEREPHAKKPDWDNLAKSTMDALNGLLWVDDSQIFEAYVQKHIASGAESPGVVIVVAEIQK